MTNFILELRLAARRLTREPGFSIPAVGTLAVGIGIAASVFALVNAILLRPLPYPDARRLVSVRHEAAAADLTMNGLSPGLHRYYVDDNNVFEAIGGYQERVRTITDAGTAERLRVARVTPSVIPILRVGAHLGRLPVQADYDPGSGATAVLISHELWTQRYGENPDVIGRTIEIDGTPNVVVGVAQEGFHFPHPETQAWSLWPQDQYEVRGLGSLTGNMWLEGIARLRPNVSPEEAEADLNRLVQLVSRRYPGVTAAQINELGLRVDVNPYKDSVVGDVRLTLILISASGGFLLLVTWANVTNLLLLRTHGRRGEIGVSRALGATERRVAARLLGESLILTTIGGSLGLALSDIVVGSRFGFAVDQLPRLNEVAVDGSVVAFVLILICASSLLMASLSLASTRQRAVGPVLSALRDRSATLSQENQTGRRVLVAAQMAVALTLLVGSGLMARTYWQLQRVELGFRTGSALTFQLPVHPNIYGADYHNVAGVQEQVLQNLRSLPGIDAVEAASSSAFALMPVPGEYIHEIARTGNALGLTGSWPQALFAFSTPGYFDAMGIDLLQGRTFRIEDTSLEAPGVILSQSLARDLFGDRPPIGERVEWGSISGFPEYTVVGVVGDVPSITLREGGSRALYLPHVFPPAADTVTGKIHPFVPSDEVYVVRTHRDITSLVPELQRTLHEIDPRLSMTSVVSLDDVVRGATAQERLTMLLLVVSAAAALFLGVVGIYGVLAYSVRRRTAELGVRLALGASPHGVIRLVVLQGVRLILVGVGAGLIASLVLTRFIGSLLYGVSPTDPITFAGTAVLLTGIAVLASYIPAKRASRIDPAQALKGD